MQSPIPVLSPEVAFSGFDLMSFGKILIPPHPLRFGFQVDIVPSQSESRQVLLALVAEDEDETNSSERTRGFAIRVDFATGEVWDLLNNSGLIGWIEKPLLCFTDEEPLLLNWEIEHYGAALIPKLQIGDEVFLYPALRYTPGMHMTTLAGSDVGPVDASTYMHPAVWRESF
jgi:hypothetical protein